MSLISVLLPVYNGMPFLPDAVDSILNQTIKDISVLVVDGGSTDGSQEYVHALDDTRVKLLHCEKGLGKQLAFGLNFCDSRFLARMDADDLCVPDRLAKQLDFLRSHPRVGLVGTQYCHFVSDPARRICPSLPTEHSRIHARLLEGRLGLVHASMMCNTEALRQAGGYLINGSGEDWDMFLRFGEISQFANLSEVLYCWRLHAHSVTISSTSDCVLRIKFACDAARRRSLALPEPSFEMFLSEHRRAFRGILHDLDCYSLLQYRRGLYDLLSTRRISGAARLAWSALCSPSRSAARVRRFLEA